MKTRLRSTTSIDIELALEAALKVCMLKIEDTSLVSPIIFESHQCGLSYSTSRRKPLGVFALS